MVNEAQTQPYVVTPDAVQAPEAVNWRGLIEDAVDRRPQPIVAETFYRRYTTASHAVELGCADGSRYVVKGLRKDQEQGRMVFNDQVAARLGALLGAPVPQVALIEVSAELITANPGAEDQMGHMVPCTAHGSKVIPNVTERINNLDHADENRIRFAILSIFFGWLWAGDRQFIYEKIPPYRVYSHDHGHFFPGGPNWATANLPRAGRAEAESGLVTQCKFTSNEMAAACAPLVKVGPEQVAEVLAVPPESWDVTLEERVLLAEYLERRRSDLIAAYLPT